MSPSPDQPRPPHPTSPQPRLILASGSPRRAELLTSAGLRFDRLMVDCDERWHAGEAPIAYAHRVARAKAEAAATALATDAPRPTIILAADTTVWLREDLPPLGKPVDRDDARSMLRTLCAGAPHRVTTACVFAHLDIDHDDHHHHRYHHHHHHSGPHFRELAETTTVHMRHLDDRRFAALIEPYLDGDEWTDKAGGYAIQGFAAALVERIEGSYTAVVGLPLAQVVAYLDSGVDGTQEQP